MKKKNLLNQKRLVPVPHFLRNCAKNVQKHVQKAIAKSFNSTLGRGRNEDEKNREQSIKQAS